MPDKWEPLRSLPFTVVIEALGFDPQTFNVRKSGSEWYGACPVHKSKQNHTCFSYNANGKWNCFSCNAKGRGCLDLVKAVKECGFEAAVAFLEGIKPPDTKKEPVEAPIESDGVLKPLEKDGWRKFAVPCPWLEARVPDTGVRERYGVFCYNNPARRSVYSGRVMLPVKGIDGALYGYLGRLVQNSIDSQEPHTSDTPKYLFPKNLPKARFLFGAHELSLPGFAQQASAASGNSASRLPLKLVYLLESPFAVMKFASLGLPAVSPFGWSVSEEQIRALQGLARGIVYLPDRNKTEEAACIAGKIAQTLWLRFPPLPDGCQDPETLTKEQILAMTK